MLIRCTKKLLDQLNCDLTPEVEEEPLFSWHANLMTLNRRKCVLLLNDETRYVIFLYGLKARDFKQLADLILRAIRETLLDECIKKEVVEKYINCAKGVKLTRAKNRSLIARTSNASQLVRTFQRKITNNSIVQTEMNIGLSGMAATATPGSQERIHPNKELYKALEGLSDDSIFGCQAVELAVTLDLENYKVYRRLIVPTNMTFEQLHRVLQVTFGWNDYHLHEFFVFGDEKFERFDNREFVNHPGYHKDGYKPIINLVCNEEAFDYADDNVQMKLETGIRLSEYIPARMKYNYDFGDDWQHYIEVIRVREDYDINYPICVEAEGNTPPEDVGGGSGYDEFRRVLADETDPEHDMMVTWGKSQGYQDVDIDQINRELRIPMWWL